MRSLSKTQLAERAELTTALGNAAAILEEVIGQYNKLLQESQTPVQRALENYNALVAQAKEFAEQIAGDAEGYYNDKSERWQESERGEQYRSWFDEWGNADLNEAEVDFPDEVEVPDLAAADTLDGLPDEPN